MTTCLSNSLFCKNRSKTRVFFPPNDTQSSCEVPLLHLVARGFWTDCVMRSSLKTVARLCKHNWPDAPREKAEMHVEAEKTNRCAAFLSGRCTFYRADAHKWILIELPSFSLPWRLPGPRTTRPGHQWSQIFFNLFSFIRRSIFSSLPMRAAWLDWWTFSNQRMACSFEWSHEACTAFFGHTSSHLVWNSSSGVKDMHIQNKDTAKDNYQVYAPLSLAMPSKRCKSFLSVCSFNVCLKELDQ